MITRILYNEEKDQYNKLINHPVQTWEWGDFQISQGHRVYRLGVFNKSKMVSAYSVSFHQLPRTEYSVGTILRGPAINQDMITNITKIATDENAVFVKFEPDKIIATFDKYNTPKHTKINMDFPHLIVSPKVAFYPYSYLLDLSKSEDELLSLMHPKTRYNIRVANRYGVTIEEKSDDEGFEIYLKLLFETTKRQGFYLHTQEYHRDLWNILKTTSIPKILLASYQDRVLAAFMLFVQKDKLFYPYGASNDEQRQVMAPTLLMWEAIRLGRKNGCKTFDMWGSLGPEAKESQQGYGFHRFKQGFGGQLVQFVGTYDLVINPNAYRLYNLVDKYRWKFLRLKAKFVR